MESNQGENRGILDELVKTVGRIETSIAGDVPHGLEGLVQKCAVMSLAIAALKDRVQSLENDRWYQRGMAAAAGALVVGGWELWKAIFHH